jgi:hypothetical protein
MSIESPAYEVVERIGRVEIRDYEGYLAAETEVSGALDRAGNNGFRTLARFIFGANENARGENTKIAMTTPVTQVPSGDRFRIRFMMPSEYTADSLPTPNDDRVTIREVEPHRVATITYSGCWSKRSHDRRLRKLRDVLDAEGRRTTGEAVWARYDPPWTPWFMRRNEIMLELDEPGGSRASSSGTG